MIAKLGFDTIRTDAVLRAACLMVKDERIRVGTRAKLLKRICAVAVDHSETHALLEDRCLDSHVGIQVCIIGSLADVFQAVHKQVGGKVSIVRPILEKFITAAFRALVTATTHEKRMAQAIYNFLGTLNYFSLVMIRQYNNKFITT